MMNPIDPNASARQYMSPMQPGAEVTSPGRGNQAANTNSSSVAAPIQAPNEQAVQDGGSVDSSAQATSVVTGGDAGSQADNQPSQGSSIGSNFNSYV